MGEHGTGGDMLRKLARKGNKKAIAALKLSKAKAPEEFAHALLWYSEIRRGQSSGMGVEHLSHQEIQAYRDLHGLEMGSFDVELLYRLDSVFIRCQPKKAETPGSSRGPAAQSMVPPQQGVR